jgi:hypothetical protein
MQVLDLTNSSTESTLFPQNSSVTIQSEIIEETKFKDTFDLLYICTTQPDLMAVADTKFLGQCRFHPRAVAESKDSLDGKILRKSAYMGKDAGSAPPPSSYHRRARKPC